MVTIQSHSNIYAVKHFVADAKEDMKDIDLSTCAMGCTVYVISTKESYILNGNKEWVLKPTSSGSGGGDIPGPEPSDDTIIYEGGEIIA